MAVKSSLTDRQVCVIRRDRPAQTVRTGHPVTLRPGFYPITGHDRIGGVLYFQLGNTYRIEARACESDPLGGRWFEPPRSHRFSNGRR